MPQNPEDIPRYLSDELNKVSQGIYNPLIGIDFEVATVNLTPAPNPTPAPTCINRDPAYTNGCDFDKDTGQITLGVTGLWHVIQAATFRNAGSGSAVQQNFILVDNLPNAQDGLINNTPDNYFQGLQQHTFRFMEKGRIITPQASIFHPSSTTVTGVDHECTIWLERTI